jgi:hypothetical protein
MRAYTKRQYYAKERFYHDHSLGWGVYRDGLSISNFQDHIGAYEHAEELNKRFGDIEAMELLNAIRNEITLYEDKEFNAETVLESIKGMLDSKENN